MGWLEAIIMGIVQGLTEFLPISSSGHLLLVPHVFGWDDPGAAFTAVIQLGTMFAVLIYFWRDLVTIFRGAFAGMRDSSKRDTQEWRIFWMVALGTIPIAIFGLAFRSQIETTFRDSLTLTAIMLIVFGIIMELSDRLGRERDEIAELTVRNGVLIGFAQSLALIPGVSRSGSTISAGRLLGLKREDAARYSFLLSVPAVVLSGLLGLGDVGDGALPVGPTIVATVVSFVVGYASIAFLLGYLARHRVTIFTVYRLVLGVAILGVVWAT